MLGRGSSPRAGRLKVPTDYIDFCDSIATCFLPLLKFIVDTYDEKLLNRKSSIVEDLRFNRRREVSSYTVTKKLLAVGYRYKYCLCIRRTHLVDLCHAVISSVLFSKLGGEYCRASPVLKNC